MGTHKKRLGNALLMSTHNIHLFCREKYMAALEEKQALIKEKIKERDEREKRELLIAAEKKVQETKVSVTTPGKSGISQ